MVYVLVKACKIGGNNFWESDRPITGMDNYMSGIKDLIFEKKKI